MCQCQVLFKNTLPLIVEEKRPCSAMVTVDSAVRHLFCAFNKGFQPMDEDTGGEEGGSTTHHSNAPQREFNVGPCGPAHLVCGGFGNEVFLPSHHHGYLPSCQD